MRCMDAAIKDRQVLDHYHKFDLAKWESCLADTIWAKDFTRLWLCDVQWEYREENSHKASKRM